ncbi:MAG: T9SS type A sorting domain-containing protein [Balneola sp.]
MKRLLLSMGVCLALTATSLAQSTILLEDFEDTGIYYTSSITEFTDLGQDYFKRTDGSDITGESFSNILGSFYFGAQDIDGEGASLPVNISINDIDISGYTDLILRVYLAEDATGASEHWDASDYVHFTYDIDEGSVSNLLWIETLGDTTNGPPGIDTDFDGNGDGTELTSTFAQFSASISGTGSLLDLTIEFQLNSGDEDIAIDNIEILGTKTIPNKIISGSEGWRLLSIPVTGATGADISDDGIGAQFTSNTDSATIYTYDDTGSFEAISSDASALTDGYGLAIYFFDNTTNGSSELPLTLDATGTEPASDVTVTLNAGVANQFTLIGNPFASNYNTNSITTIGGDISDNVSFWNDGTSSYSPQDRTTNYIVAPWQGFWVETADASVTGITIGTAGKSTSSSSGTFFSKTVSNRGDIAFTLSSENSYDEAIKLAFREYATLGFDRADASKMTPLTNAYATMAFKDQEGKLKSVESLPWNLDEEIKLDLELTQVQISGGFTFDWKGLETIPSEWKLTFHDYEKGTEIDMRSESKFVFDSEAPASKIAHSLSILNGPVAIAQKSKSAGTRFAITITPSATSVNNEGETKVEGFALSQNYPNPFNPTTTINYSVENSGPVTISVYNLMGQKVAVLINETKAAGSYNVTWNAANSASGMYYYRLEAGGQTMTRKMTLIK